MSEYEMKEVNRIFADRLNQFLREYDMTRSDLAKKLNVSTAAVTYWCNGIKSPRMDKVDAMCAIFHCRRSDFMEDVQPAASSFSPSEDKLLRNYRILDQEDRLQVDMIMDTFVSKDKYKKDANSRIA